MVDKVESIVEHQRRTDALETRYHILERQRQVYDALLSIYTAPWTNDFPHDRLRELAGLVALNILMTCEDIWDLSEPGGKTRHFRRLPG